MHEITFGLFVGVVIFGILQMAALLNRVSISDVVLTLLTGKPAKVYKEKTDQEINGGVSLAVSMLCGSVAGLIMLFT